MFLHCKKTAGTYRKLLKQESWPWTFVCVEGIEPTSNDSEQVLLHGVFWRKSSRGTDSESGSRFVERMLNVVATTRQQTHNVLELLTACCRARLNGSAAPFLLPTQAELVAAWLARSPPREPAPGANSSEAPSAVRSFRPAFQEVCVF